MKGVLIVDGAYMMKASKSFGFFDYVKLKKYLEDKVGHSFVESYYLNSTSNSADAARDGFHTFMKSAPPRGPKFRLQLYDLKDLPCECPSCQNKFERQVQKGVDVGIATLVLKLAIQGKYDALTLCAGDGDFEDAIKYVVDEQSKEFNVAGFGNSLSTDLQSYAKQTIYLEQGWVEIQKETAQR